jgi:hypothetical protein
MLLIPPHDAPEAFARLAPDLREISEFIGASRLNARERRRLAHMLASHFEAIAREYTRPELRLVRPDASAE